MVNKDIILFGTGTYFDDYMVYHSLSKRPSFAIDNDVKIIGTAKRGLEIKKPEILKELPKESFYVIICSEKYREIANQLDNMDILDYQQYTPLELKSPEMLVNNVNEEKLYKIGYVPGVFDLFHIGHLNLLRNAKARCEYLIAGVLTDELVEHFKGKRPVIRFAQRQAIVESIKYVDRVVAVDFDNTVKIDAWKKYRFDCHFSGNDHGSDWNKDLKQLREVGSNMEFFNYTTGISSTQIKQQMDIMK